MTPNTLKMWNWPLNRWSICIMFFERLTTKKLATERIYKSCTLQVCEEWMKVREDRLNEHFSQSDFKLDQGEALLKEMQQLRDELSQYEDEVRYHLSFQLQFTPAFPRLFRDSLTPPDCISHHINEARDLQIQNWFQESIAGRQCGRSLPSRSLALSKWVTSGYSANAPRPFNLRC